VTPGLDRRSELLSNHTVVGIDYLFVDNTNQTDLYVHFVFPPSLAQQAQLTADRVSITAIAGDAPPVAVRQVDFPVVSGELVMRIRTAMPGTFTQYTLVLANPPAGPQILDPYLAQIEFSFKAGCYSDIDCKHAPHVCPPEAQVDAPVDYQARDFWSLRTALLDFASQRYPRWADRLEADAAVMLAEVMSAVGDELAYYQDRVAREAYLETATQRRSLRRLARLIDYRIHDGLGASTVIDVTATAAGAIPAGTSLQALRDGVRVDYSVGRDLDEMLATPPRSYAIDPARNDDQLVPYQWDVHYVCVPRGATELYLTGDVTAALKPFDDLPSDRLPGRWVLLRTDPLDAGLPARRHLVRVIAADKVHDPLANVDTTHIVWEAAQALPFELDLVALHVHGNIIPAVAGVLLRQDFLIGPGGEAIPPDAQDPPWAVERQGPNGAVTFLFSLPRTDTDGLVRRARPGAPGDPRQADVELAVVERVPNGAGGFDDGRRWQWRHSLLDSPASTALDPDFTLDDGTWRRVVGYRRGGGEFVHVDYAANEGVTVRFGDGEFGAVPSRGTQFRATYLAGNGRRANLPAGAVTRFDQPTALADLAIKAMVSAVENPLAIDDGVDPETPVEIRQLAPDAFRAVTYRAVRPEDYAEAVERLAWVQRAGCSFRWTGSWLTAFATPDPLGSVEVTAEERAEAELQLDRFRQAGRETHVLAPRYADLDLKIKFCVASDAYASEVKTRLAAVLTGTPQAFFSADHFTFGTPLERSRLEAAIQGVPGVRAVEDIQFRRRGFFDWMALPVTAYLPGQNEVIRVENDRLHPDRGSVQLLPDGGA
jgi:hypothetical protein